MTTDPPSREPPAWTARAVVFDLDGTLIDTEWVFTEAARRLLARRGKALELEFMASIMGVPGRDALPRFRTQYDLAETVEQIADEYKLFFIDVLGAKTAPLMPGALELINRLDAHGTPKAIATSSGREYVEAVFAPLGLIDRFAFVLTANDVTHGKPAPDVYQLAARRLGVPAADVLVLEDSLNGVRAAKAAGAFCVMVPHDHTPAGDRNEADAVVPSLAAPELCWLTGLPT